MVQEERLKIVAIMENIEKACDFVANFARSIGFSDDMVHRCALSVEEVCANVIEHGYRHQGANEVIDIVCRANPDHLVIIIIDDAQPFNPLNKADPDPHAPLQDRQVGGWGIFFVKKFMDKVHYHHINNRNQLTLEKYYPY